MDEEIIKQISANLRKPEGEMGLEVAGFMNSGNELMNRRTIKSLDISPDDNIFEIGMANGHFVKDILSADASIKYTGCDFSELMTAEAKKKNKIFIDEGRAEFFCCSAENLPFEDKSFNKLFTVNTIYFWDDPEAVLRELHRVLIPGGLLIITVRPKWNMLQIPFTKYGFTFYSDDELKILISESGFKIISFEEEREPDVQLGDKIVQLASTVITALKVKNPL